MLRGGSLICSISMLFYSLLDRNFVDFAIKITKVRKIPVDVFLCTYARVS